MNTTTTTTPKSYFTTTGNVRGGCGHKHKSVHTAIDCLERDYRGCKHVGGYSDRRIFQVNDGERTTVHTELDWDGRLVAFELGDEVGA